MGGGKPTVPERLMDTLTPSGHIFAHSLNFTNSRCRYYTVTTGEHLKPFQPINYVRVIAFSPDSLRAIFYDKIISLPYSAIIKSLSLVSYI